MRARSAAGLIVAVLSVSAGAQTSAPIQSPEIAFGFKMGADRELADWPSLQRYFEAIAAASDRVELVDAGPTTEGRRLVAAIVSSPENIARLEEIRVNAMRLSDPRTLAEPDALAIAQRQPVIVAIGMSIHSTEIAATQAAPELLHTLATSQDPEVARWLRDVVVILLPSLNPDGHAITVDWYRKWKGTVSRLREDAARNAAVSGAQVHRGRSGRSPLRRHRLDAAVADECPRRSRRPILRAAGDNQDRSRRDRPGESVGRPAAPGVLCSRRARQRPPASPSTGC